MANLKEIRTRLSSVKSTRQITSAMKMVAAAKLRKAQDRIVKLRPYAGKLHEMLVGLSMNIEESDNEVSYSRVSDPDKVLLVVITSNRGLCGAFNTNVIKEAGRLINEDYGNQAAKGTLKIMTIGKKGNDYFRKTKTGVYKDYSSIFDDLTFESSSVIAEELMQNFLNMEFDRIVFVYNQFRNAAIQDLTSEVFLPVTPDSNEEENVVSSDYIFEPSKEEIVNELIPKSLKIGFYKTLLDSWVSEHGARMTAMHMATDNATELIRDLTLEYNKARQAQITNQILEVVNGAEALNG